MECVTGCLPAQGPVDRTALLKDIFADCDDDGSGNLSLSEFKQLATKQDPISVAMQAAVFKEVDTNADRMLSEEEFVNFNLSSGKDLSDAEFSRQAAMWRKLAVSRDWSPEAALKRLTVSWKTCWM